MECQWRHTTTTRPTRHGLDTSPPLPSPRFIPPLPLSPVTRTYALATLVLFSACASRSPRFPGPLAAVGSPGTVVQGPQALSLPEVPEAPPPVSRRGPPIGTAVASAADHYLSHRPRGFRDDCSGFVCAAVDRAGLPIEGNTRSLWEWASEQGITHRKKVAKIGDLVFFDNTYDRNKNGRWDDALSHIAIVIRIGPDGTMTLAHSGTSKGRTTMTMNLHRADDATVNSYLRAKKSHDKKSVRYLSGQLWRGFATLSADDMELSG
jgi:hypothetical protein